MAKSIGLATHSPSRPPLWPQKLYFSGSQSGHNTVSRPCLMYITNWIFSILVSWESSVWLILNEGHKGEYRLTCNCITLYKLSYNNLFFIFMYLYTSVHNYNKCFWLLRNDFQHHCSMPVVLVN